MTTIRCRAKNPATCRTHGAGDVAGFTPTGVVRNFGLHGQALADYQAQSEAFIDSLPPTQMRAVFAYTAAAYREINAYLRGGKKALRALLIADTAKRSWPLHEDEYEMYLDASKGRIKQLDKVMRKAPVAPAPRVLYKAFRVFPKKGQTQATAIREYIDGYAQMGQVHEQAAYTSTSLDSDYMITHCKTNGHEIIVHEILTDKGLPVTDDSGLQAVEREVILPRNMRLEVVGVRRECYAYSGHQPKLSSFYGDFKIKPERIFTVVQLREVPVEI